MNYSELVDTVIHENETVLHKVDEQQIEKLIAEINKAKKIELYAMGRMGLSMRGFAMRLKHMGFDAYIVYDTITPSIGKGDLLLDMCGVTNVEKNVVRLAKEAGATIGIMGPHPENEIGSYADFYVRVPGQIFGGEEEVSSIQPMSTLLEQSMFLLTDIITMMIIDKNHVDIDVMHKRHCNLEGLPQEFAKKMI
jgi:6-phospho-3-hexuloisomerase